MYYSLYILHALTQAISRGRSYFREVICIRCISRFVLSRFFYCNASKHLYERGREGFFFNEEIHFHMYPTNDFPFMFCLFHTVLEINNMPNRKLLLLILQSENNYDIYTLINLMLRYLILWHSPKTESRLKILRVIINFFSRDYWPSGVFLSME